MIVYSAKFYMFMYIILNLTINMKAKARRIWKLGWQNIICKLFSYGRPEKEKKNESRLKNGVVLKKNAQFCQNRSFLFFHKQDDKNLG